MRQSFQSTTSLTQGAGSIQAKPMPRRQRAARPADDASSTAWQRWSAYLEHPIDGAALAVFRICFGLVMFAEACRYLGFGWVRTTYVEPEFLFTFLPFIKPWPGSGMYWHFLVLGVLGAMIAAGYRYRLAAGLFCVGFTYVFLLEKAQYLNHLYLVCLVSFLLFLTPAHRCWSLDSIRAGARNRNDSAVPRWSILILRFQVVLVYCYAGIAKLNEDWLRGEPQRYWLSHKEALPVFGPYLSQEWVVWLVTYAGLGIDLFVGFLLCFPSTFAAGALLAIAFHVGNAYLFSIGIFPVLMICTIGLFAPPDWPRAYVAEIKNALPGVTRWASAMHAGLRRWFERSRLPNRALSPNEWKSRLTLVVLHVYVIAQILVPHRHVLYPGTVHWTEEGHRFSWHMMLRHKDVDITMYIIDPRTGQRDRVDLDQLLTPRQRRKMPSRPDMIHQLARYLAEKYQAEHGVRPAVHAVAVASLNRRPFQHLIDPNVDLAAEPWTWRPKKWILPLRELH